MAGNAHPSRAPMGAYNPHVSRKLDALIIALDDCRDPRQALVLAARKGKLERLALLGGAR